MSPDSSAGARSERGDDPRGTPAAARPERVTDPRATAPPNTATADRTTAGSHERRRRRTVGAPGFIAGMILDTGSHGTRDTGRARDGLGRVGSPRDDRMHLLRD